MSAARLERVSSKAKVVAFMQSRELLREKPNQVQNLAITTKIYNINENKIFICNLYQKSNDIGIILNFNNCTPL